MVLYRAVSKYTCMMLYYVRYDAMHQHTTMAMAFFPGISTPLLKYELRVYMFGPPRNVECSKITLGYINI